MTKTDRRVQRTRELLQWWLEKRQPHTPENLAQTFHRLQRSAIRDAFGLRDGE